MYEGYSDIIVLNISFMICRSARRFVEAESFAQFHGS